ncbi:MAG: MATE family efflux transporter [Clostridiales bacterium]|nr:MATE family efflux transporter [Clostridiales bacterium]
MRGEKVSKSGDFSQGSIAATVLRMAAPITLAEIVHVLYNLVDRMFIARIPEIGTAALSGIGIAFPLITLISGFANLCGTGGNPLCSIARGEGDKERARSIMESSFSMLLLIGVALMIILLLLAEPILGAMGGDEETLPYALEYINIYLLGTVFTMISLGMNPFINGMGFAKVGMGTVLIGAVLNIVLDPIFIFVFDMGVKGAAIATVISQFVSAAWVLIFLTGKRTLLKIEKLRIDTNEAGGILRLGATGFMFKFSNSIAQAVVNLTLKQFAGALSTLYIAAMSIINSIREVISQPLSGITTAAVPIMSYNYGAAKHSRVKETIKFMTKAALGYNVAAWLLLMLAPGILIAIFTGDAQLTELTIKCLRIYYATYFMMSFQLAGQNTFVALNRPKYALFFSILRKLILIVPLTLLLPRIGMGVDGVFWAEVISQLLGASACFATMYFTIYKKLPPEIKGPSRKS